MFVMKAFYILVKNYYETKQFPRQFTSIKEFTITNFWHMNLQCGSYTPDELFI